MTDKDKIIIELKAENKRLKEELATYGATGVCEVCSDKANKLADKYLGCLQEIKEIAVDTRDCKQYEIDHDCFNDTRCKALREFIETLQEIINLITKAESEG